MAKCEICDSELRLIIPNYDPSDFPDGVSMYYECPKCGKHYNYRYFNTQENKADISIFDGLDDKQALRAMADECAKRDLSIMVNMKLRFVGNGKPVNIGFFKDKEEAFNGVLPKCDEDKWIMERNEVKCFNPDSIKSSSDEIIKNNEEYAIGEIIKIAIKYGLNHKSEGRQQLIGLGPNETVKGIKTAKVEIWV